MTEYHTLREYVDNFPDDEFLDYLRSYVATRADGFFDAPRSLDACGDVIADVTAYMIAVEDE